MNEPPLTDIAETILNVLEEWQRRTKCTWDARVQCSFIDEEPQCGYKRQRRGPKIKITLVLTDTTIPDKPESASFEDTAIHGLREALGLPYVTLD